MRIERRTRGPRGRRRIGALAGPLLLFWSSPAASQTVNTEALRKDPYADGWSIQLTGSYALSQGNVQTLDVGASSTVQYQTLYDEPDNSPPYVRQRVFVTGSGRLAEQNDDAFVSRLFAHARWTGMWWPTLGTELFSQLQRDRFLRVERRLLTGTGLRLEALHLAPIQVSLGSSYMLESERVRAEGEEGTRSAITSTAHRWSNYAVVRALVIEDRLSLQQTIYVQPRFDDFSDIRLLWSFEVDTALTNILSLGVELGSLYDSRPAAGVLKKDLSLQNKIKLQL